MYCFLLTLSYDGSQAKGWVIQNNQRTIQGELNKAIKKVIKTNDFKTLGASKTDAGVHAKAQKVLLTCNFNPTKLDYFVFALNKALPSDIKILDFCSVDSSFNVRQAKTKIYTYTINDGAYDVFQARYQLQWEHGIIDLEKLQNILNLFVGTHDFKLFSGLSTQEIIEMKTIRTIDAITVARIDSKVVITFVGQKFIRYQIRMIVGAALSAYLNKKITQIEIQIKLKGIGDKASIVIEPNGLCLEKIIF